MRVQIVSDDFLKVNIYNFNIYGQLGDTMYFFQQG